VLLGVTRPVTLDVVLNGSMKSHPFAKVPALGFSAKGSITRTAFGLNPPPIREGVGDEVELLIEAEFLKQP
jgi:polyisoprenoid-binding protein YceI